MKPKVKMVHRLAAGDLLHRANLFTFDSFAVGPVMNNLAVKLSEGRCCMTQDNVLGFWVWQGNGVLNVE
jgi:hypothetical protein